MRKLSCAALVLALAMTVTACGRTVGETIDDTTITTRVKTRLDNDPQVGTMRISVATVDGQVQLAGFADSDQDKRRAEDIARGDSYVKAVRNDTVVRPPITQ